jgi:hypothetical protein
MTTLRQLRAIPALLLLLQLLALVLPLRGRARVLPQRVLPILAGQRPTRTG